MTEDIDKLLPNSFYVMVNKSNQFYQVHGACVVLRREHSMGWKKSRNISPMSLFAFPMSVLKLQKRMIEQGIKKLLWVGKDRDGKICEDLHTIS